MAAAAAASHIGLRRGPRRHATSADQPDAGRDLLHLLHASLHSQHASCYISCTPRLHRPHLTTIHYISLHLTTSRYTSLIRYARYRSRTGSPSRRSPRAHNSRPVATRHLPTPTRITSIAAFQCHLRPPRPRHRPRRHRPSRTTSASRARRATCARPAAPTTSPTAPRATSASRSSAQRPSPLARSTPSMRNERKSKI